MNKGALLAVVGAGVPPVAVPEPALVALGTITVANTNASNADIPAGTTFQAQIPTTSLAADGSNLRVFAPDGVTQVPFYIDNSRQAPASGFIGVHFRVPATIAAAASAVFSWDNLATGVRASGSATFDQFLDGMGGSIDLANWDVEFIGSGPSITPQKSMAHTVRWTRADFSGKGPQAVCETPYGIVVAILTNSPDAGASYLYLLDAATGATLSGPVQTAYHPTMITWVPEQDLLIVCATGTDPGNDFKAQVHRAATLEMIGKIWDGVSTNFPIAYSGANKLMQFGRASPGVATEYTVDWTPATNGTATSATNYSITATSFTSSAGGGNFSGSALTSQGSTFSVLERAIYWGSTAGTNFSAGQTSTDTVVMKYDVSTSAAPRVAQWRNCAGVLGGAASWYELEGISIHPLTNAMIQCYWDHGNAQFQLWDTSFSWSKPAQDPHGFGIHLHLPPTANVAASVKSKTGLLGASKLLFGSRGSFKAGDNSIGNSTRFGAVEASSFIAAGQVVVNGVRKIRNSSGDASTTWGNSRTTASSSTTTNVTEAASGASRGQHEIRWDGTNTSFYRNETQTGTYTAGTPSLASASAMKPTMYGVTNAATDGLDLPLYFLAANRHLAAGQSEPTITVA